MKREKSKSANRKTEAFKRDEQKKVLAQINKFSDLKSFSERRRNNPKPAHVIISDILIETEYGNIDEGPETSKLLKIIPQKELSAIIAFYRLMISGTQGLRKDLIGNYPNAELKKIHKSIETLEKKGWLSNKGAAQAFRAVKEQMAFSDKGSSYIASKLIEGIEKTGGRRKKDPYLKSLIYVLAETIRKKTKYKHIKLIADFLNEQEIINGDSISEECIKKQLKRHNPTMNVKGRLFWVAVQLREELREHPTNLPQDLKEIIIKTLQ